MSGVDAGGWAGLSSVSAPSAGGSWTAGGASWAVDDRAGSFAGYAPEESAILEQSTALVRGRYAALLICPDQQAAKAAFDACFTGGNPPAAAPWPSGGKLVSIDPAQGLLRLAGSGPVRQAQHRHLQGGDAAGVEHGPLLHLPGVQVVVAGQHILLPTFRIGSNIVDALEKR